MDLQVVSRALLLCLCQCLVIRAVQWEEWWTYEGISGPAFWGLINPEWNLCSQGRLQSPINLEPSQFLFDPNLRPLRTDPQQAGGYLTNVGHGLVFFVDNTAKKKPRVNITGGPLSYRYEFQQMSIHFGRSDNVGSEHLLAGKSFPAELQIFGYNSQLYNTFAEALDSPHGIAAIAVLVQITEKHSHMSLLMDQLSHLDYAGRGVYIDLSLHDFLPATDNYITYDGSLTIPACQETVTWIVMNKPIYITKLQLSRLRKLRQGIYGAESAVMGNNFRPIQAINQRPVRTNINHTHDADACKYLKNIQYRENFISLN